MLVWIDDTVINMDHIECVEINCGYLYFYTIREDRYYYFSFSEETAQDIVERIFDAYDKREKTIKI